MYQGSLKDNDCQLVEIIVLGMFPLDIGKSQQKQLTINETQQTIANNKRQFKLKNTIERYKKRKHQP